MNKIRSRKFAWVALVFAMALVGSPAIAPEPLGYMWPFQCPPMC